MENIILRMSYEEDMANRKNLLKFISNLLFSLGILIGFFFLGMVVWGDLEASLFSSSLEAKKTLSSLRCPVFMTPTEKGIITAKFKNPTEKDFERYTHAFISEGFVTLMREIKMSVPVPSGGKEIAIWDVYPEDAAYDRIIFFRVYVNAKYPLPSLGGSCGIIMMDLWGLSGQQITAIIIIIFVILITLGIILWLRYVDRSDPFYQNTQNVRYALTLFIIIGSTFGYFGSWVIALMFFAMAVLLVGIIIGHRMSPTI